MDFSRRVPPKKEQHAEPEAYAFNLPAFRESEFMEAFDAKLKELGLVLDRDVVLSVTPIGTKGRRDGAEELFVKVTFNAPVTPRRPNVAGLLDVLDDFNPDAGLIRW